VREGVWNEGTIKGKERRREKSSELLRTAYKVTGASETYSKELVHYGQVVRGSGVGSLLHWRPRKPRNECIQKLIFVFLHLLLSLILAAKVQQDSEVLEFQWCY
jgi:hypothetical protein